MTYGKHRRINRFFRRRRSRQYLDITVPTSYTLVIQTKPTLRVQVLHDDGSAEHVYEVDLNEMSPALLARELVIPVPYQHSYSYN